MRTRRVALAALGAAAAMATTASAASGGSSSATIKIPLPAPNTVQVSSMLVQVTAPKGKRVGSLKLSATNAAELGGRQLNSQVIASVSPKSSNKQTATFKVVVFIHRYPPAPGAADRPASTALTPTANLRIKDATKIKNFVKDHDCTYLEDNDYDFDNLNRDELSNLVPSNDTAVEEQLDGAVFAKGCASEQPDPGSK